MLSLQDLLDISEDEELLEVMYVTDNYSEDNISNIRDAFSTDPSRRLSTLNNSFDEFYSNMDFCLELEVIESELEKERNRTFVIYDENFEFIKIAFEKEKGKHCFKRNCHSVFILLVYGFSRKEIMEILQVSRSYVSSISSSLREKCEPLKYLVGLTNSTSIRKF